jgi:hypothetical protein
VNRDIDTKARPVGLTSMEVCAPFNPDAQAKPGRDPARLGPVCPWCPRPRHMNRRECSACERMAQRNGREDGGRPVWKKQRR